MRKLGWYAVSAVVALVILGGILLLAANLYVQSAAAQAQIRRALASSLQMPVEITKTTVTPWEGVRIDGIRMRPRNSEEDFLTAASFRVQFALLPLFHRELVVQSVLLDQPEVAWAQNEEGRWQYPPGGRPEKPLPETKPGGKHHKGLDRKDEPPAVPTAAVTPPPATAETPPASPGNAAAPPPVASAPVPPVPAPAAPPAREEPAKRVSKHLAIAIDKLKLRHGVLSFLDIHGRPVGRFEELNLDSKVTDESRAHGALWFGKASLPRTGLNLTDFRADFTYDGDTLSVSSGEGKLAGGTIQLDYRLNTGEDGSPFAAACHVKDVSLDELITEAGGRAKLADGRLQGEVQAEGKSGDPDTRRATAQLRMVDARFANLPVLQTIGEALRIEDISQLRFKKAQLDGTLEGFVLHVNPLVLVSNDLQITAQGDYRLDDDRLGMRARLVIDRAVGRQLPQFIEENFQPCGDDAPPGSRYLDFDITGSLARPKSNLFTKILSGSANGLLQNLFGTKKKHDKKPGKHGAEEEAPPADEGENQPPPP